MSLTKTMPLMMQPDAVDRPQVAVAHSRGLPPGVLLMRYTESGGTCNYTYWDGDRQVVSRYLLQEHLPSWLRVILDAAKLGDHFKYVKFPPPNVVLWCEIDANHELVKFVNWSKPDVS